MSALLPSEKSSVVNSVISEFSLNDFTEKKQIGSGNEGEVFCGYNDRLGNVTFKRLYMHVNKTEMSEVILLAEHFNHPNIIRLFGLLTPEEGYSPNSSTLCIGYIMEYMENGSLYNVIHNTSVTYDMEQVYSWIEKASSGLQYLHKEGVLHRDINPQNILLGKSLDDLRISDFGLPKAVEPQSAPHTGGIETIDYMAPELHNGNKYDKSTDIYALTITFWEIIHRERPYAYMGKVTSYKKTARILNGERPNIQGELEISALLIRGWDSNAESRPDISEFIEFSRKAQENLRNVISQQNVNQNENKVEKLSGGQQNISENQKKLEQKMEKIEIGKEDVYCTSKKSGRMSTLKKDVHTDDLKFFQPDNFLVDSSIFAHPMNTFLRKLSTEEKRPEFFSFSDERKKLIILLHEQCGITINENGMAVRFDLPENLKTLSIGVESIPIGLVAEFLQMWKKEKKNLQRLRLASFEKVSNKQELADELLKNVRAKLIWTVTGHDETMFCDTNIEEYQEKLQTKYGFAEDPVMLYFGASDDLSRLFSLIVSDYGIRLDFRPNDCKHGLDFLKKTFQAVTKVENGTWVDNWLFEKIYSELERQTIQ